MLGGSKNSVRIILRLEGLFIFTAAVFVWSRYGVGWGVFLFFFLAPDISFLGYLAGRRIGILCYNVVHTLVGAIVCLSIGFFLHNSILICVGLIWCAHIGLDRAFGYGLKYLPGLSGAHLNVVGGSAHTSQK